MKRILRLVLLTVTACVLWSAEGKAQTPTTVQVRALVQGLWNGTVHRTSPVSVELRAGGGTPLTSTLVSRLTGMLSSTGTVSVTFPNIVSGNYWIIVRHGGSLPVCSATQQSITAGTTFSYDFSDASTKAYSNGTIAVTLNSTTYYVLKSGDLTGDRAANPSDIPVFLSGYPKTNASAVPSAD